MRSRIWRLLLDDFPPSTMAHEEWVERAEKDFEAARFNHENGFNDIAAFLYQQAAEKSLKGVLIALGQGLERTHDCFALAQKAEAPDDVQDAADRLTLFYTRNRYPDRASVEITGRKLNLLQSAAEEVLQWTRSTL